MVRSMHNYHYSDTCTVCVHVYNLHSLLPYTQPTMTGAHRTVVHDIPVAVVPVRLWPDYQEPDMPEIDVSSVWYLCQCTPV